MKRIYRHILGLLLVGVCAAVWVLTTGMARRELRTRTCQGKGKLQVTVTDSLERRAARGSEPAGAGNPSGERAELLLSRRNRLPLPPAGTRQRVGDGSEREAAL